MQKLIAKGHMEGKVHRKYNLARTPYRQMFAFLNIPEGTKAEEVYRELNSVVLQRRNEDHLRARGGCSGNMSSEASPSASVTPTSDAARWPPSCSLATASLRRAEGQSPGAKGATPANTCPQTGR
ncbi:MAG: hypothetical protein QXY39_06785, partial [Thermofilaceae archaeon]